MSSNIFLLSLFVFCEERFVQFLKGKGRDVVIIEQPAERLLQSPLALWQTFPANNIFTFKSFFFFREQIEFKRKYRGYTVLRVKRREMLHNKHSRNIFNNIAKHLGTTSCDEICNKILRPPAMLRNDRFELPFNARMKELGSLPRRRSSSHLATDSGTLTGICPL